MSTCGYPTLYAGMDPSVLQAALTSAQTALIQLNSGAKVVTASYAQGDGVKTVTFTAATREGLTSMIRDLQAALGVIPRARRPMRFTYR